MCVGDREECDQSQSGGNQTSLRRFWKSDLILVKQVESWYL